MWVPDPKHEALRDLVRAREAAKQDTKRAKHRLGKYLLRYGQRPGSGCRAWTAVWWQWVRKLELPHPEQNTTLLTEGRRDCLDRPRTPSPALLGAHQQE